MVRERYADATLERLDVWNVQKDYLQVHGLIGSNTTGSTGYIVTGEHNATSDGSGQSLHVERINITHSEVTIRPGVEVVPDDVITRVINDDRRIIRDGVQTTFIEPDGDTHIIRPPVDNSGVDIIVLNGTIRREERRRTTLPPRKSFKAMKILKIVWFSLIWYYFWFGSELWYFTIKTLTSLSVAFYWKFYKEENMTKENLFPTK